MSNLAPCRSGSVTPGNDSATHKVFIYAGLCFLVISFVAQWLGAPTYLSLILRGLGVLLKVIFIIATLRSKTVRVGLWFYLIMTGVLMILVSLLFRNVVPIPIMRYIFFYGAISFKVTGLLMLLIRKKHNRR